jgi:hypothetical protein
MTNIDISFASENRKAVCQSDPMFPNGKDFDLTNGVAIRMACLVELPYPAKCCGKWILRCRDCGFTAVITAAGRRDDPRKVTLPCKEYKDRQRLTGAKD